MQRGALLPFCTLTLLKNLDASAFSPYILRLYETQRSRRDTQAADRERRAFEDIRDYIEQA